jgi:phage gp36-like protein
MYATTQELKDRLKYAVDGLYSDESGIVDDDLISDDLIAASAMIDGSAAARYQTPITAEAALPLLRSWCLALAIELAYGRAASDELPKKVKGAADNVRTLLTRLESGSFKLPGAPAETANGPGAAAIIEIDEPFFTSERMKGY